MGITALSALAAQHVQMLFVMWVSSQSGIVPHASDDVHEACRGKTDELKL